MIRSPQLNASRPEHSRVAFGDDGHDASERRCNAQRLNHPQPVAKQGGAGHGDHDRRQRIEHRDIDCRRVLQADVLQRTEDAATDRGKQDECCRMRADQRPVAPKVRHSERQQQKSRDDPSHGGNGERWYMAGNGTAGDMITRPAERRQRQTSVGQQPRPRGSVLAHDVLAHDLNSNARTDGHRRQVPERQCNLRMV